MPMDLLPLTLLGGLLALDGTSVGQFMISRPLVAGALTGWVVGDPFLGLLLGGVLEVYFISIFPVGGAEFPEGGPPTLVAVATAAHVYGPAGIALGALLGLILSRAGALSIRALRKVMGRTAPNPAEEEVSVRQIVWGHLGGIVLDFGRGSLLTFVGLLAGILLGGAALEAWPLGTVGTLVLLGIGGSIPAGAFLKSLGGWRGSGVIFGAGVVSFLLVGLLL